MGKINLFSMNLQRFAGENNENAVAIYRPMFVKYLQSVYQHKAYFAPFFNGLQTLDDIAENDTAFTVKVNNQAVIDNGEYLTGENVAFGTGTSNSNRFGPMQEIKYNKEEVKYTWGYTWNEGIDRRTIGTDESQAVAERLGEQAKFKIKRFNQSHGKFISDTATPVSVVAAALVPTQTEIVAAFDEASVTFTDLETVGTQRAYVTATVYNTIVNSDLATTSKNSSADVDSNEIYEFKGFILDKVPSSLLGDAKDLAYFTIDRSGEAFTGIATARTIESADFDGRAFQGAGKAGEYIIEDNKKAVLKFTSAVGRSAAKAAKTK